MVVDGMEICVRLCAAAWTTEARRREESERRHLLGGLNALYRVNVVRFVFQERSELSLIAIYEFVFVFEARNT